MRVAGLWGADCGLGSGPMLAQASARGFSVMGLEHFSHAHLALHLLHSEGGGRQPLPPDMAPRPSHTPACPLPHTFCPSGSTSGR